MKCNKKKKMMKEIIFFLLFCLSGQALCGQMVYASKEETGGRSTEKELDVFCIEIDPGHGGHDSGAEVTVGGDAVIESALNLQIAKDLKKELETYDAVKVYLTREDDSFVELEGRVKKAEEDQADLLVSIHNDAKGEMFVYENGCSVLTSYGAYKKKLSEEENELACNILEELSNLGLEDQGIIWRTSQDGETYENGKLADYYNIVKNALLADIPGIIIEHAFMDHEEDYNQFLNTLEKLNQLAVADATGIARYYGLQKEESSLEKKTYFKEKVTLVKSENIEENTYMEEEFGTKKEKAAQSKNLYEGLQWKDQMDWKLQKPYIF